MTTQPNTRIGRQTIVERTYSASVHELWALWTTKEGFESWWGPEGFAVKVRQLDPHPGGEVQYSMTAVGPAQIQCMQQAGLPLTTEAGLTFTAMVPGRSIAYSHRVDFVPGVEPYEVPSTIDFHPHAGGTRVVLKLGDLHSDEWTDRSAMGMESQLNKIPGVLKRYQPA